MGEPHLQETELRQPRLLQRPAHQESEETVKADPPAAQGGGYTGRPSVEAPQGRLSPTAPHRLQVSRPVRLLTSSPCPSATPFPLPPILPG